MIKHIQAIAKGTHTSRLWQVNYEQTYIPFSAVSSVNLAKIDFTLTPEFAKNGNAYDGILEVTTHNNVTRVFYVDYEKAKAWLLDSNSDQLVATYAIINNSNTLTLRS